MENHLPKIAHIAISVSNIERTANFYRKHFGFCLAEKYSHKDIGLTIAVLKNGNSALELFEFKKHKRLPGYRKGLESDLRTLGVKHFSFEVADIEKILLRLRRAKVRLATDIRTFDNGCRYFFLKDPDGILVEVMEAS